MYLSRIGFLSRSLKRLLSHASNAMHNSKAPIDRRRTRWINESAAARARRSLTHRMMVSTSGKRVSCARLGRAIVCGGHGPLAASSHREINLVERQPFRSFHRSLRPPGARDLPSCTLFSGLQHSWKCPYMDCEGSSIHGRCYQICRDCIWIVKCQSGEALLLPAAEHQKSAGDSSCTNFGHLSCSGLD